MAHQVTERDGLFTVREPAWHGIGEVLTDYPTREEAQKIAHGWEPVQEPLFRKQVRVDPTGTPIEVYEEVPGWLLNARSDNDDAIGVVSSTYTPVTNSELYDIAEAIEGQAKGSVRFETGGSLKGGRKVWLLVRLNEPVYVNGDPNGAVIPYYALQNAHDGSGSFRGQATMTRIVCDNTAQMADLDAAARGTEFVFRHTSSIRERIEDAKEALARWRMAVTVWRDTSQRLMDLRLTSEQVDRFVHEFVPDAPPHMASKRVQTNIDNARGTLFDIINGETCADIGHTGYGMVQAAIEYGQHYRAARTQESRFRRSYLRESDLTRDAVELAYAIAK
jgi:phage/plasmid-like protein (TIGR03299 family)